VGDRYLFIPEYRAHPGCSHPVHDHTAAGCLTWRCPCTTPRRDLAGPSGLRQVADRVLWGIGALWVLWHLITAARWLLAG